MELEGKVAMISGGSRGLGRALARRFSDEGAAVSICARSSGALRDTSEAIRDSGGRCLALPADVSAEEDVDRWFAATLDEFGAVDVVVNNASVLGSRVPVEDYSPEEWRRVLEVNLTGAFLVARRSVPPLRDSSGSLIHVSSGVGDHGRPRWGAYCVSKNGLEALGEMIAGELESDGVRSNVVDPGRMRTGMRAAAYPGEDPSTVPEPADVTDVFVYLASDRSGAVTGERLVAQEFMRRTA